MGPSAKRPAMKFYSIDYPSPVYESQTRLPLILEVEPFEGVAPYDTTRIIYSTNRFARNRYVYHQWIAKPSTMITPLLVRDIRCAALFQAVITTRDPKATHVLRGTVEQFYEQDTKENWNAVLSITVTLIKKNEPDATKAIGFQKSYTHTQVCEEKSPQGLAAAMSTAVSRISEMIIADIRTAVSP